MILLDGSLAAASLQSTLEERIGLLSSRQVQPCLAIICVGEDPASMAYIARKRKKASELSIRVQEFFFPQGVDAFILKSKIEALNGCADVHGILLQLPLPSHLNAPEMISLIDPLKDVDGLHPFNQGLLFTGHGGGFIPCTPLGCFALIQHFGFSLQGRRAVIVGRSNLVGRPLGSLLLQNNATVTWVHSHTADLASVTVDADFLFVAVGVPGLIQRHHVKTGACVVDVGINSQKRSTAITGGHLVGDVDFESVRHVASAISPVPGGVGPMTVISLMKNVVESASRAISTSL